MIGQELRHVHSLEQLKRAEGSRHKRFKCSDPLCKYVAVEELVKGKIARCPVCSDTFVPNSESLRLKVVICHACQETRKARARLKKDQGVELARIQMNLQDMFAGREE